MTRKLDCRRTALLFLSLISLFSKALSVPVITGQGTVNEGDSIVLTCTDNGGSVESFAWLKDSEPVVVSDVKLGGSSGEVLTIVSADRSKHSGSYQCATGLGGTSIAFDLTVQYFDGLLSACKVSKNGQMVAAGRPVLDLTIDSSITVECCYGSSIPAPEISWRNSNQDIVSNNSLLTLESVQHSHTGKYTCRVQNSVGVETHEIFVFVPFSGAIHSGQYDDVVLRSSSPNVCGGPGGVAVLPCEILSGDVVKIRWFYGSTELSYSSEKYTFRSNELVVYGLEARDIGTYRCSVKGENGDVKSRTIILRDDCIESVVITQGSQISVGVMASLSLACTAMTSSTLQTDTMYTWTLPDGSSLTGSELYLNSVGYSMNGVFTCTVSSDDSSSLSADISVMVTGPLSVDVTPNDHIAKLNHTLNVTCHTNTSGTHFVWKNGSEEMSSNQNTIIDTIGMSSVLSIKAFKKHDVGQYSCAVKSPVHVTVAQTFTVSLSNDIYLLWDVKNPAGLNQDTVTLICPVAGGKGNLTTNWYRNNTPVTNKDRRNGGMYVGKNDAGHDLLSITMLDLLHEYDMFTCETIDSSGARFEKQFKVIVEIPASFKNPETNSEVIDAFVGEVVEFKCEVMGKPMPNIIWRPFDGQMIQERYENFTNGTFRIHNISHKDEGKYLCYFKWKETKNTQSKFYTLRVATRQVGSNTGDNETTEATILGLERNVFISIIVAVVGGIFLLLALLLCCCLLCRYCCCQKQQDLEMPRIALETTSFERKPSLRGSYRFKDNSGILGKNAPNPTNMWTFQADKHSNSIPMTTASSVAVSPDPPIPSPVPTPLGPTTSMVTAPEFQLPNNVTSFPRQSLKLDNVMGEGEFGPVFKGVARNIIKGEEQSLVAVKVLISREGEENLWPSLMEFANQMKLSSPFIASILGICSDSEPYYVIYDYMDRGDLKRFLFASRPSIDHPPSLTQSELLHIVTQVSQGMSYLYKQQIIHGDLATRNCLIGSDLSVKIADLGIGHDLYSDDYHDNGTQLLPIRWMALELFLDSNEGPSFSLASDVWSFGVFCWEVFAYARQPYDDLSDDQVLRLIPEGHVLSAPEEGCPPLLFSLMQDCWAASIDQRPIFTNITSAILSIDVD